MATPARLCRNLAAKLKLLRKSKEARIFSSVVTPLRKATCAAGTMIEVAENQFSTAKPSYANPEIAAKILLLPNQDLTLLPSGSRTLKRDFLPYTTDLELRVIIEEYFLCSELYTGQLDIPED
nr:hypothetical protein Iba_chr10cCG8860 [Ipomoea batatas]